MSDNPLLIGPACTVHCSISDWGKYLAAHLRGERGQGSILKAETFKKLHVPNFGGGYAFGWAADSLPPALKKWETGRALWHAGSNRKNFALVWMPPARDFAVAVTTNQGGHEATRASEEVGDALIQFYSQHSNLQSKAVRE